MYTYTSIASHSTTWFLVVIQGELKNTLTKYIWDTIFLIHISILLISQVYNMRFLRRKCPSSLWPFGISSKFFERCCIFLLRGKWERKGKFSKVLLQLPFNNGLRSTLPLATSITMVSRRHVLIPGKFQTFPASNTNSYSHHHHDSMARIIPGARSLNSLSINNNTQSYSAQLTGANHLTKLSRYWILKRCIASFL